jgi:hypothetical protein
MYTCTTIRPPLRFTGSTQHPVHREPPPSHTTTVQMGIILLICSGGGSSRPRRNKTESPGGIHARLFVEKLERHRQNTYHVSECSTSTSQDLDTIDRTRGRRYRSEKSKGAAAGPVYLRLSEQMLKGDGKRTKANNKTSKVACSSSKFTSSQKKRVQSTF